jgi:hypothetical protein
MIPKDRLQLAQSGMLWRFASVALVALSLGCSPQPPSAHESVPAIERALERKLNDPEMTLNGLPGYDPKTCGTRVQKVGTYDRKRQSWPVRATTCCGHDSVTAVYRLTRNEFGEWVAEFDRWEE